MSLTLYLFQFMQNQKWKYYYSPIFSFSPKHFRAGKYTALHCSLTLKQLMLKGKVNLIAFSDFQKNYNVTSLLQISLPPFVKSSHLDVLRSNTRLTSLLCPGENYEKKLSPTTEGPSDVALSVTERSR